MTTYLKNISSSFNHILIPLSGGLDSRTILSFALKSKIHISCYTCDKKDITDYDKKIPHKICKDLHIPYHYICKPVIANAEENAARAAAFDHHTFGLVIDRDREYYIDKQIPNQAQTVCLGGGAWEVIRKYYSSRLDGSVNLSVPADKIFAKMKCTPIVSELLEVYTDYLKENEKTVNIPFFDRFYLEQRIGCWLSGIEHSWDLYDTVRLQPIDCQNMLDLLFELGKRDPNVQLEFIKRNEPKLLRYGINQMMPSLYSRIYKKIKRNLKL